MISFSSFLPKQWKWDYLTVLFTLLLITYIPITSQYWIFYHAYPPFHHLGYFLLHLFFDFCILNLYINYFLAMFTHPGRVPAEWVPRWITDTNPSGELIEVKKSIQKPRFCRTCNQYKPPRSHHCRQCQQCILKMDHHCPWVNNCIGHLNLAYFLRFLLFVNLSTTLCGIGLIHQCYILFVVQFLVPYGLFYFSFNRIHHGD
ncbi:Palmitoyltransferase [Coelomomyces lativittatus]|nr:Palmitoyltransferase [Coelomomyces lativittatus]